MKNIIILSFLLYSSIFFSQAGINTSEPKATFDITAKKQTGTFSAPEGLLLPRVDRQKAQSMVGVKNSTLIYVNDISRGTQDGIAVNIDTIGFYFFNGKEWAKLKNQASGNGINIYTKNGSLTGNRIVSQNANNLAFKGISANVFSVNDETFSVNASNQRVGIGSTLPTNKLLVKGVNAQPNYTNAIMRVEGNTDNAVDFGTFANAPFGAYINSNNKKDKAMPLILNPLGSNVGINTNNPNASAILDLSSTNQGFLMTRLSTAQRDAINPKVPGLAIYNTTLNCMQYWDSTAWRGKCQTTGIGALNCSATQYTGKLQIGQSAGFNAYIPYTGGNGGTYGTQTINSTGISGLQLYIYGGTFANGNGNITGWINGTPQTMGIAYFAINIGGKSCTLSLQVQEPAVPDNNSCSWTIPFRSNGGTATSYVGSTQVTATLTNMTMSNVSNSPTTCGLSQPPLSSAYGTYSSGIVKFKFNKKVANFKIRAAGFNNNGGNDIVHYTLYKNGQRVYPTNIPKLSGCTGNWTVTNSTAYGYGTILFNLGGVWFDEIEINFKNYLGGAVFEFCVGNAY